MKLKGNAQIVSDEKTITVNENDVFYIPKNLSYRSFWYGDKDDKIEFLSFGYLDLNTKETSKIGLQIVECNDDLKERILNIPTFGNKATCSALAYFYSVMIKIIPKLQSEYESSGKILLEKVKAIIRKNPYLSLNEVAQKCNISEPYLYKLFKNSNMTPNEYRQIRLCEIGIELLSTTDKKIEEIASIINFSSSSYFRKVLKKYTSLTPSQIRNINKL